MTPDQLLPGRRYFFRSGPENALELGVYRGISRAKNDASTCLYGFEVTVRGLGRNYTVMRWLSTTAYVLDAEEERVRRGQQRTRAALARLGAIPVIRDGTGRRSPWVTCGAAEAAAYWTVNLLDRRVADISNLIN